MFISLKQKFSKLINFMHPIKFFVENKQLSILNDIILQELEFLENFKLFKKKNYD